MTSVPGHDHGYQPPRDCPVCGEFLHVTRLGCESCGTELSGRFASCAFCSLGAQDRKILSVFLVSRGNMRELARELGVSYPTARQRYAELLARLGVEESTGSTESVTRGDVDRDDVLRRLAAGEIPVEEATALLS